MDAGLLARVLNLGVFEHGFPATCTERNPEMTYGTARPIERLNVGDMRDLRHFAPPNRLDIHQRMNRP